MISIQQHHSNTKNKNSKYIWLAAKKIPCTNRNPFNDSNTLYGWTMRLHGKVKIVKNLYAYVKHISLCTTIGNTDSLHLFHSKKNQSFEKKLHRINFLFFFFYLFFLNTIHINLIRLFFFSITIFVFFYIFVVMKLFILINTPK